MKRKIGRAVAAAVGGVGAVAGVNRTLARRAGDLEPPLPGETGTYRWRGIDVAYTEAGDPEDPDVLLLHGINAAATSKEFESIFEELAEDYHVIAPDLPGFGRSERPPVVYTASFYESFVSEFASDVTEDATCIASSLTAAYAVVAATEAGFSRMVLACPTASTMPGRRFWMRSLLRMPVVGTGLLNLATSKPSIRYFGADHGFYDIANKPEGLTEYQWKSTHQRGGRYAPASFLSGYLDPEAMNLGSALATLDIPVTLVWGREAETTPLQEGRLLAEEADCRLVVIDYAKLQPHVEYPDLFLEEIREIREGA